MKRLLARVALCVLKVAACVGGIAVGANCTYLNHHRTTHS